MVRMSMPILRPILLGALAAALLATGPARASAPCSDPACDEQQIGPYVAPDIETPNLAERFDPRGKPLAVPGLNGVVVRHRPGAGVWLGEAPGSANLFLKPGRQGASVGLKVDF